MVHLSPRQRTQKAKCPSQSMYLLCSPRQFQHATRVDVIFDRYITPSIKSVARTKRGESGERRLKEDISVPAGRDTWKKFLHNSNNKSELYRLLAKSITTQHSLNKDTVATIDDTILAYKHSSNMNLEDLTPCNHEEADTRIFLHAGNASNNGHASVTIRSSDTDVLVIGIHHFKALNLQQLWIATGTGKDFRYLPVHEIVVSLGLSRAAGLAFFHAFTGCDTVSNFYDIGKRTAWNTVNAWPEIWEIFTEMSCHPDSLSDSTMESIEKFTVLMYNKHSKKVLVNEARREMIGDGRTVDKAPPTHSALLLQAKRACYVGGHQWRSSLIASQMLPIVTEWGWKLDGTALVPVWTLLPIASKACKEFIRCGCKITKKGCGTQCKCRKHRLPCTELCKCRGECCAIDTAGDITNPNTSAVLDVHEMSDVDVADTIGERPSCSLENVGDTDVEKGVSDEPMDCTDG